MVVAYDINITKIERSKLHDIHLENIPFGKYFTDHMLEADYEDGEWKNVEIKPYLTYNYSGKKLPRPKSSLLFPNTPQILIQKSPHKPR